MKLSGIVVLHCAQYAAPYEGNFIKALRALEIRIMNVGGKMIYVFPPCAKSQPWCEDLCQTHDVLFVEPFDTNGLLEVLDKLRPAIIHTHFEGYDITVAKIIEQYKFQCSQVWHLHDYFCFLNNPVKAVYQFFCFFVHYNYYAKNISVIGVNRQILMFVNRFKHLTFSHFLHQAIIPNGIDLNRIRTRRDYSIHNHFTFLAFGGRNADKRIDLLLDAASLIASDYNIKVLITQGVDTKDVISSKYGHSVPEWLNVIPQQEDISSVFDMADCFVSTSVHETFSFAICEATAYGLPVIQSNIEGTSWNAGNPSVITFESENISALSKAMVQLITRDSQSLEKDCDYTQRINRNLYNLNTWTDRILDFYHEL